MTIDQIKEILTNKVSSLSSSKEIVFREGNLEEVLRLEGEISETQTSLNQLNNI